MRRFSRRANALLCEARGPVAALPLGRASWPHRREDLRLRVDDAVIAAWLRRWPGSS